jgi:hypothetical protein
MHHIFTFGRNWRECIGAFFWNKCYELEAIVHWARVCPMQLQTKDFVISFQNDLFVLQVIKFYHSKYGCHTLFCVGKKNIVNIPLTSHLLNIMLYPFTLVICSCSLQLTITKNVHKRSINLFLATPQLPHFFRSNGTNFEN